MINRNSILLALSAVTLIQCAPKERPSVSPTVAAKPKPDLEYQAPTPEAAFEMLPPEQQLAFSAWKLGLVKNCSVPDAFLLEDGQKPYGPQNVGLDARLFTQKVQNSLFISKREAGVKDESPGANLPFGRSRTEFALLGSPVLMSGNQVNRFVYPVKVEGKAVFINIEAEVKKENCSIRVAGQTLFEVPLISQVPIEAYYSENKALQNPEVSSGTVKPAVSGTRMGFDARSFVEPVRSLLDPASGPGAYQALDFIARYFQSSEGASFSSRFFFVQPLVAGSELSRRLSLKILTASGENPPVGISGWVYGSAQDFEIFNKPGTVAEGEKKGFHRVQIQVSMRPGKMKIGEFTNSADSNLLRIDALVDYFGALKPASKSQLRGLIIRAQEPLDEAKSKSCLGQRLSGARLFQNNIEKPIGFGVNVEEVVSTCSANSEDLKKTWSQVPEARTELALFVKNAGTEKDFNFRGWDETLSEVAKSLVEAAKPDQAASELQQGFDPQSENPAIKTAVATLSKLVSGFGDSPVIQAELGTLAQFTVRTSIRNLTQQESQLSRIALAGRATLPVFKNAFRSSLTQLSVSQDPQTLDEIQQNLEWASAVNPAVLGLYSQISLESIGLGIPQFQEDLLGRYQVLKEAGSNAQEYLASLALARQLLDEDAKRFPDGITLETARLRESFATLVVSDKWTTKNVEQVRSLLGLRMYLKTARSECRKPKDLASQVMCIRDRINPSAFSKTVGLLTPEKVDSALQLGADLENVLSKFPADHVMTDRVANRFFGAGWTYCSNDEIRARNYLVRAYLASMLQDPKKSNPNLENGVENNFRACAAK